MRVPEVGGRMSMLQAQADELRAMAASVGLEMPQAATLMMDAADTIWELRNKCADLVSEREHLFQANVEKNNEMLRLVRENAKLRKLVKDALPFFCNDMDLCVGGDCFAIWECCEGESSDDCPAIGRMWERARELGVEP